MLKEKKTKGEDEKRERTLKGKAKDGGAIEKTDSHAPYFLSQEQSEKEWGKKVSYIFLDVWSEPKGPPLQGHNAIKHSEMKCLIGGDKGGRGGREGSNRGCSQASRMKARAAAWWG